MSEHRCVDCGAPETFVRKFKWSGYLPTCECQDIKNEAKLDEWLRKLKERRA